MSKAKALAKIREIDGHFYDSSGLSELIASAITPRGLVWHATGCHTLTVGFRTDRAAGWQSLLSDLLMGTERCTDEDCEMCAEGDDGCGCDLH